MNFLKVISLLLMYVCLICSHEAKAQSDDPKTYKLFVNLENAPFDSLYLQDYTEGRNILIHGKKTKEFTWEITIPNNIVWNSENMLLLASLYNSKSNSKQMIRFVTERAEKKVIIANVGVEEEDNYIFGVYQETNIFHNEKLLIKVNNKDSVAVGDLICVDFNLIIKDANSDIAIRSQAPFFSWFLDFDDEKMNYDSILKSYINLSKKYPDSRFLMSSLARMLARYKSKSDVKKVYENFTEKHKNTIWAKRIEQYLHNIKFENTSLPTFRENKDENMVQDTSKYNLIIFSASWCLPCIEEIPLLKNIYKDLNKDINFTYVSLDDAKGIETFKKLNTKHNIPWRTLFAYPEVENIKQKYFIEGIPHNILVYPNQNMEVIDVRKNLDREKLYAKFKSIIKLE